MNHPMSRAWDQPDKSKILLDETYVLGSVYAVMGKQAFKKIAKL